MLDIENSEYQRRAELIISGVIKKLEYDMKAMQALSASKGSLRSGKTIKDSSVIARGAIQSYFLELEDFAKSRPANVPAGFDAKIIESISKSTSLLINSVNSSLLKNATLVGDATLTRHIEADISNQLSASQDTFRSNMRAYWDSKAAKANLAPLEKVLIGIEVLCIAICLVIIGMWIQNPQGPYESYLALFATPGVAAEVIRRVTKSAP